MAKVVLDYEWRAHGVDYPSYFPGCSATFTRFEHCATGIGDTEYEAGEDALEMAAQGGHDVSGVINDLDAEESIYDDERSERLSEFLTENPDMTEDDFEDESPDDGGETANYYVSILYNTVEIEGLEEKHGTGKVKELVRYIRDNEDNPDIEAYERLPELAAALREAGCEDTVLLTVLDSIDDNPDIVDPAIIAYLAEFFKVSKPETTEAA